MRIKIIAIGTKMPQWVQQGYDEYARRLPRDVAVELLELPLGGRGKGKNLPKDLAKAQEAKQILSVLNPRDRAFSSRDRAFSPRDRALSARGDKVVALDVKGTPWSTEQLAAQMSEWQMGGTNLSFLIGGPDGLAEACLQRADQRWSLSPLTLPHPLVRVVLIEQLYRAWTILQNHPYHK